MEREVVAILDWAGDSRCAEHLRMERIPGLARIRGIRSYNPVDGHGVAMAAIKGIDRLVQAQRSRIESLEQANRELERRIRALEAHRGSIAGPSKSERPARSQPATLRGASMESAQPFKPKLGD